MERVRPLWEQILYFKRSSHFEKGRNRGESLLDPVVSQFFRHYVSAHEIWVLHWVLPSFSKRNVRWFIVYIEGSKINHFQIKLNFSF